MNESKTIAVDLAKDVFELVAADAQWRIVERQRLTRTQLSRYFQNHEPVRHGPLLGTHLRSAGTHRATATIAVCARLPAA